MRLHIFVSKRKRLQPISLPLRQIIIDLRTEVLYSNILCLSYSVCCDNKPTCHGRIAMDSLVRVRQVLFYTRSDDPHNRQMVAIITTGTKHRFSEGEMVRELQQYSLPEPTLRRIEKKARSRVETFFPPDEDLLIADSSICEEELPATDAVQHDETVEERDLRIAQNLLSEFQDVLASLYG